MESGKPAFLPDKPIHFILYYINILSTKTLQQSVFLRLLRLFAANQFKSLSLNTLRVKLGFSNRA